MAFGLFGNFVSSLKQTISSLQAGQFDMLDVTGQGGFVPPVDEKLIQSPTEFVNLVKHQKTGEFHVIIHFRPERNAKMKFFSVFREKVETLAVDVANRFRTHADLINVAKDQQQLKILVERIHAHQLWDSVHIAASVGLVDFFTLLLERGHLQRLNAACPQTGVLPIHIAVERNQLKVVEYLLSLGADIKKTDVNGMNAFHYAASVNAEIIQALAKHPEKTAALNATNGVGRTPLYIAVVCGNPECVMALIAVGATGDTRCEGKTLLEAALESSRNSAQIVESIAGAFPFLVVVPRPDGSIPLHYSNGNNVDARIMKSLIRAAGSNPELLSVRNASGETPLHSAIRRSDLYAVVCLIAHGCSIDDQNAEGQTPLHLSLSLVEKAGQLLILKALLIFGADTAIPDNSGRLPRHVACTMHIPLRDRLVAIFNIAGTVRCSVEKKGCVDSCRYLENESEGPVKNEGLNEIRQRFCVSKAREKKQQANAKLSNLLALDGGGVKGIVLIQVLLALEKLMGENNLLDCFDWVAGTSTGSIVAAAFCKGRSLREVQRIYFCMKDSVMDTLVRPYNSKALEDFLKAELGPATMGDLVKPKLIITTVRADIIPVRLTLIRNYQLPLSEQENIALGYDDTRAWPLWKAVRCSSAAPTYFDSVDNRYVDGGLIANNPTLDLLTEFENYRFAASLSQNDATVSDLGCVVSIGCGVMPTSPIKCSMDVRLPSGIFDTVSAMLTVKNWGDVLINQATATDGSPVDRSRAWCHSLNVPFFRFSPPLFKDVPLDTVDDSTLIQALWCTVEYLHDHRAELKLLADLLK